MLLKSADIAFGNNILYGRWSLGNHIFSTCYLGNFYVNITSSPVSATTLYVFWPPEWSVILSSLDERLAQWLTSAILEDLLEFSVRVDSISQLLWFLGTRVLAFVCSCVLPSKGEARGCDKEVYIPPVPCQSFYPHINIPAFPAYINCRLLLCFTDNVDPVCGW
jgi:hypothetical protein